MAAPRLHDAQKQDLISRFQAGETTQELADAFGCSANTVIRVVKAALEPAAYERLKRQRSRRSAVEVGGSGSERGALQTPAVSAAGPAVAAVIDALKASQGDTQADGVAAGLSWPGGLHRESPSATPTEPGRSDRDDAAASALAAAQAEEASAEAAIGSDVDAALSAEASAVAMAKGEEHDSSRTLDADRDTGLEHLGRAGSPVLAIDDADDFGDEGDDDLSDEDLNDVTSGEGDDGDFGSYQRLYPPSHYTTAFVEVPIDQAAVLDQPLITPRPFRGAAIPASVYMLVDKTVELQALPLAEIPDLGRLAPEELELQALVLYTNPRQAKRLCGRSQRVIKLPDTRVLERTASYLIRQGIQRLVIEGDLYALSEG